MTALLLLALPVIYLVVHHSLADLLRSLPDCNEDFDIHD